jgi:hypothetical protein
MLRLLSACVESHSCLPSNGSNCMRQPRSLAALILLATIPLAAQNIGTGSAQSKRTSPNHAPSPSVERPETGRFHLLEVKTPGRSTTGTIEPFDEVFLYDTATGRVWKYEPSSPIGGKDNPDSVDIPAYFDELTVDNLHGSHDEEVSRSFSSYSAIHNATVRSYCNKNSQGTYHTAPQETGPGIDCADFLAKHPDSGPDQK